MAGTSGVPALRLPLAVHRLTSRGAPACGQVAAGNTELSAASGLPRLGRGWWVKIMQRGDVQPVLRELREGPLGPTCPWCTSRSLVGLTHALWAQAALGPGGGLSWDGGSGG